MKRLACALAVAGSAGALAGSAQDARAAKTQSPAKAGGLQLSILTPDPSSILDQLSLDVVCKGAAVESVELFVDNALVAKRQINSTQSRNILSFKLDTLLMSAGDHDVIVKAFSPDGKSSSSSARLRIPVLDLNAPVRISYPQNGTQVSGIVPVRLTLDSEMARARPYVTFFVDKEFKVLRNTPPYEFNWDTSRYTNGWHILEAWSQDADAASPTKARPVNVNVNNGGGQTPLQTGIKNLRTEKASSPIVLSAETSKLTPSGTPTTSISRSEPGSVSATFNGGGALTPQIAVPTTEDRTAEPRQYNGGSTTLAATESGSLHNNAAPASPQLSPRGEGGLAKQPAVRMARTTAKQGSLPGLTDTGLAPSLQPVVSPGTANTVTAEPRAMRLSTHEVHLHPGTFAVAFDGTQIAFDVQPRVEAGVKLAPFRQIFEHTGGRLYWFGGTAQTVRAVNSSREIEIKIGDKAAKVNNQTVEMQKKPYLDTGRTIVPLTFIRDALDVKINYDEKTGRLLIESKK